MKKLSIILVAAVAMLVAAVPAEAKFRIGPRVGIDVSSLHFNSKLFKSDNRVGVTAGVQAEVGLPLGLTVDGSVMYVRRTAKFNGQFDNKTEGEYNVNRDYINVPINLKWNLGLPLAGKFIAPYIFTGPDFAFLASKKEIMGAWKDHTVDVAWNFGIGLEFISHLQISASYGLGITKLSNEVGLTTATGDQINGRNNNWTVTAAWLF